MPDETCGNPDCLICDPLYTRSGRMLTSEELDALSRCLNDDPPSG